MEGNATVGNVEFESSSEKNAGEIAALIRKINAHSAEFRENWENIHSNIRKTKVSLGKKLLCCLKIF
jgi:hypothetical protein